MIPGCVIIKGQRWRITPDETIEILEVEDFEVFFRRLDENGYPGAHDMCAPIKNVSDYVSNNFGALVV